eukprot:20997-Eustigmatos_ZCMA.PRE.1
MRVHFGPISRVKGAALCLCVCSVDRGHCRLIRRQEQANRRCPAGETWHPTPTPAPVSTRPRTHLPTHPNTPSSSYKDAQTALQTC